MSADTKPSPDGPPTWLQLESIVPLPKVRAITSLSDEALRRNYSRWLVQISERRKGMKLKHVLEITNGEAV